MGAAISQCREQTPLEIYEYAQQRGLCNVKIKNIEFVFSSELLSMLTPHQSNRIESINSCVGRFRTLGMFAKSMTGEGL